MISHRRPGVIRGLRSRGGTPTRPDRPVGLRQKPPDEVSRLAEELGLAPQLSIAADLDSAGCFGARWLLADATRLLVISANGAAPRVETDLLLADLRRLRIDSLVGAQALTAEIGGDERELVRYSNAEARRFAKACRRLEDWRKGDGAEWSADEEPEVCPRCGQKLPQGSKVCTHCLDRRRALRRLVRYLRPHLGKVVLVSSLVVFSSALDLIGPQLHGLFFDRVLAPDLALGGGRAGRWVAWMFTSTSRLTLLVQIVSTMLLLRIMATTIGVIQGRIAAWLGYYVVHDIRNELYSHLQSLTLRYFDKHKTGAVMSRVTQDTRAMQGFLIDGAQGLVDNLLKLVAVGAILLTENWRLALLTILPMPLVLFFATAFWKRLRILYGRLWQRWEVLTAALQDSLSGIRVVKAFAGEQQEVTRFRGRSASLADAGTAANQLRATIFPWLGFSVQLSSIVVWFYGGWQVIGGEMSTGQIMQFLSYLFMFVGPMQWISQLFNWFNETLAAAERVWEVLDEQPDVAEPAQPVRLDRPEGRFTFENVTFGYEPHEPVLKDVNLEVAAGEMIGLVGHSGAGKSTLINLICRFYDVNEGRILIDGHDLRDMAGAEYRRHIGVVLQDSFLFNGTVLENISYSAPGMGLETVIEAARAANAHDFIVRFPDGYDTIVGERGQRLSGGERQRISIARAILHNPRILILDEATASVDTETEQSIQEALRRLIKGRTTFAIAHRLSTLRNADRLVVIEKGRIAEVGTHDELLDKPGGVFAKLVRMQESMNRIHYVGG